MIEELTESQLAEQFEHFLTLSMSENDTSGDLCADLHLAARLRDINLCEESQIQRQLRARLAKKMQGANAFQSRMSVHRKGRFYSPTQPRVLASVMITVLLLLAIVSNTPVCAALGRILGYGYLPYAGFISLSDTRVIQGPVTQSTQRWSLSILQGVEDPQETILWIRSNLDATIFSAAQLILPDGTPLPVRAITSNQEIIILNFDSLPDGETHAKLVLAGGWQLPMEWMAANQAGLAPTQVSVPFESKTPDRNQSQAPCIDLKPDTQICVQAAFTDIEGTHLLLQAFQSGQPSPLTWNPIEWQSIKLKDEAGRTYPIHRFETVPHQTPSMLSVRFTGVPSDVNIVTLLFPPQALILPGSTSQQDHTIDLTLRLPNRVPTRSPTPGVVLPEPDHPIAIPTPGTH